jgi:LPS export ABC transporter protein LptC/lipopolysaccharide transport protein LptA
MARWQAHARLVAGLFTVALGGVVYFSLGERRAPPAPPPVERMDPGASVEVRGGNVVQFDSAARNFTIEFGRQLTYPDGRSAFGDVTVRIDNRGGRNFVITGKEAAVGENQSSVDLKGDVVLTASDGLRATGGQATYAEGEGIVRVPGPVTFARARMTGSGVGFTYDKNRDTVWLLDQARIVVAAGEDDPGMDITAGAAGEARKDRYMRFERGMKMVRGGQVIEADDATVHLFPDRDEPDTIELRGNARISGGEGMGSLQAMQARDINLDYADDGRTLQSALLSGTGSIQLANADGSAGQRLAAENINVALAPDGAVTALSARDRVQVTVPGVAGGPSRTVRSSELAGQGEAGRGLTGMRFVGNVEFREATGPRAPARTARSRQLDLVLDPASGQAQDATFIGGARFEDGDLRATAAQARYQIAAGTLALSGKEGNAVPRVTNPSITVDADAITVGLATTAMKATGAVQSVLQAARGTSGAGRTPALLEGDQPVYVTAQALDYDGDGRKGTYQGQSRLWQGETAIQADRIVLDESRGDLSATGTVRSTLVLADPGAPPGPPSIGRGEEFRYDDAARTATYTKNAQLSGPQGDLKADRIELLLAAQGRTLERLEGYTQVSVRLDKRTATGARLTYFTADGRYVLHGTPVQMVEECRETQGRTLTFFRAADKILIDGNEEKRTQTKGGGKCPEPPRVD